MGTACTATDDSFWPTTEAADRSPQGRLLGYSGHNAAYLTRDPGSGDQAAVNLLLTGCWQCGLEHSIGALFNLANSLRARGEIPWASSASSSVATHRCRPAVCPSKAQTKAAGSSLRCDQHWRSNIAYCADISVRPTRKTGTVGFRHLAFLDQLFAPILARLLWINRTEAASSCAS